MRISINPKYKHLSEFLRQIPNNFDQLGEIVYDERNTIRKIEVEGICLSIKSFCPPMIINKFAYTFIRPSKAKRSYEYAIKLLQKGIGTPIPIAYIEQRQGGLLHNSYFVCLHLDFTGMMREFRWGEIEGREDLLGSFAHFSAYTHEKGVRHMDYSPGNILYKKVDENYRFCLVDINRMAFGKVGIDKGCANFSRLWGSDEMLAYIAKEYALARDYNVEKCVRLTLKYHKAFWEGYSARHNGFKPYLGPTTISTK
ncbi:hypothetical protein AwDysgo_01580 [Bacteroidales bacterium]|nr:hypothetical protein AwDysgo_01580 [Bacteroidales bacterium]